MYRNEDLLRLIACLPCQECGVMHEAQAAHSNLAEHGKGRSIKASDAASAALCHTVCHEALDQGDEMNRDEKAAATHRYIAWTYITLMEAGYLTISPEGRRAIDKQSGWQG